MRIFSKEKQNDIRIVPVSQPQKFFISEVIAKTAMIMLLSVGAIGGFLSAFEIEYDQTMCILVMCLIALFLSAVYQSGKRLWMNLSNVILVFGFLYLGFKRFWYINSGYYAIVNKIFQEARRYLGIFNGTEYGETITNQYATVTYFVLFIGLICVILLNINFAYGASLPGIVVLTLPLYVIPLYLEKNPDTVYIICLVASYLAVALVQCGRVKKNIAGQLRFLLPVSLLAAIVLVKLVNICVPVIQYKAYVPQNEEKEMSETNVKNLVLFGLVGIFGGGSSNAGISGGRLDSVSSVRPDYETDLIVEYTPYSMEPVYLKAFTAKRYEGNRWFSSLEDMDTPLVQADNRLVDNKNALREIYMQSEKSQGRGIMKITNVGAASEYQYYPYYTDFDDAVSVDYGDGTANYRYYPYNFEAVYETFDVDDGYLLVSQSCKKAVETVCIMGGFHGSAEEIAEQVVDYFDDNYTYTLRPGSSFGYSDFISRFLIQNKKGFCAHFASAATMIFRYMGIPARYVEGYVFSYNDVLTDGDLVEDARYEDYYEGYSELGETALIRLEVPDANAHAWVEIYVENKGWIVVDPTPASAGEDTESFWDAFQRLNGQDADGLGGQDMGAVGVYLKRAVNGIINVLLIMLSAIAMVFAARRIYIWKKYTRLNHRERIVQQYTAMINKSKKHSRELAAAQTIERQIQALALCYQLETVDEELLSGLYKAYFAPGLPEEEAAGIWERLLQFKKQLRRRKRL